MFLYLTTLCVRNSLTWLILLVPWGIDKGQAVALSWLRSCSGSLGHLLLYVWLNGRGGRKAGLGNTSVCSSMRPLAPRWLGFLREGPELQKRVLSDQGGSFLTLPD